LKVLYILNHFLPSQTAGTEVYVWALAKQLKKNGEEVSVVIPNYNQAISTDYMYDELYVHRYAEPSVVNRSLVMGFSPPEGLKFFNEYLAHAKPDIIHFHGIGGSNGISIHHIRAAKKYGAKVLLTFHLSGLSCMTGTLMQNGNSLCDGKIDSRKCSICYLHSKQINNYSVHILTSISHFFNYIGLNPAKLLTKLGTALGTVSLIKEKYKTLHELTENCDRVIVLSAWYKGILKSNGVPQNKIISIPQGLPSFSEISKDKKNASDIVKFVFVGRISPFKGLHLLIDAFMKLDKGKAELHIYGQSDGTDYEKILIQITKSINTIYWKGLLEQSEVVKTISEYDALCLTSTFSEMSPLVIQEAFAAKIPVIASNVYGNAEQINHGENGLLFKFNDCDDLLNQLERCIQEKDLLPRLASNIMAPRSFEVLAGEHLELYKSLLN